MRRLQALLAHAYEHAAYYRRVFDQAGVRPEAIESLDDLRRLPTLSKREVREHLSDLLADNYPKEKLRRDSTGGSTGIPVVFDRDLPRGDSRMAVGLRHDGWTGWRIGERLAYVWGAQRDFGPMEKIRWRLASRFVHRHIMLDAAALDEESMHRFAAELQRWRPALIVAYAGGAYVFSKFLLDRGIRLPAPKGVVCTAESLYPQHREVIERALGAPVFNRYGTREMGLIASECDRHLGDAHCRRPRAGGRCGPTTDRPPRASQAKCW